MKVGGLLDVNPFLLPLLAVLAAYLVFHPFKGCVRRALPLVQLVFARNMEKLQDHFLYARFSPRVKLAAALVALVSITGFVSVEVYYLQWGCTLSER